jgi:hypothetical protein
MQRSRRDQLSLITILIVFFLLSLLLATNLNSFLAPVGPNNSTTSGNTPQPSFNGDGMLVITIESNLTVFPSSRTSSPVKLGNDGFLNSPIRGVLISITNTASNADTFANFTNSYGQFAIYLPAATYKVGFLDWRLNFSTMSVDVYTGEVTRLDAHLNATTYPVQTFNIVDPDSSGWALGWGEMYALIPSVQAVTSINSSTFVETNTLSPTAYFLDSGNPSALTRVSVIGSLSSQNSQWLEMQVKSPLAIATIHTLRLLSMNTVYLVSAE